MQFMALAAVRGLRVTSLALLLASSCHAAPTPSTGRSPAPAGFTLDFVQARDELVLGQRPVTRTLALTPALRHAIAHAAALTLQLEDVQLRAQQALVLRVFAQHPEAHAGTDVDGPRCLGYLAVPGQTNRAAPSDRRLHLTLDVSTTLPPLLGQDETLALTLVPATAGRQAPGPAPAVRVGRLYLSVEPRQP
jgi:hypothetical protein